MASHYIRTMANFFQKLFGGESLPSPALPAAVQEIVQRLESLPAEEAARLACFAYVLGRAANADSDISDVEIQRMREIVVRMSQLSAEDADLIVDLVRNRAQLYGSTEDFIVTREFAQRASPAQKEELLHCVFAVVAADDSINSQEEAEVQQISFEMNLTPQDYLAIREHYNAKRDVLKDLPGGSNEC